MVSHPFTGRHREEGCYLAVKRVIFTANPEWISEQAGWGTLPWISEQAGWSTLPYRSGVST